VYLRTACTLCVRNVTEERKAESLHDSQRARAGSIGGEKSFVPCDGWVSPTPQSNPNSPTSNGCSAPPCTYRVQIYLPRMAVRSSEQLQCWPLHSTPLALALTCKMPFCLSVSSFRYKLNPAPLTPASGKDLKPVPTLKSVFSIVTLRFSLLFHFGFHSSFPQDNSLIFLINFPICSS
jgi:hypothetical protein